MIIRRAERHARLAFFPRCCPQDTCNRAAPIAASMSEEAPGLGAIRAFQEQEVLRMGSVFVLKKRTDASTRSIASLHTHFPLAFYPFSTG